MRELTTMPESDRAVRAVVIASALVIFFVLFGLSVVFVTVQPVLFQERVMALVFGVLLGFTMFLAAMYAAHLRSSVR